MEHYRIYHSEIPAFLSECAETPVFRRLGKIGMNCGCEYTSFPVFSGLAPYTRYDHSIGVALIVWHFTHDRRQAIAGLLHDIASPVFAHVVDFMRGDYLKQESTEEGTEALIAGSAELQAVFRKYGITTADVCDYHQYPIADNDPPRLSSDRLEYTIENMINFGLCTAEETRRFFGDLAVGINEDGNDELVFRTLPVAEAFANTALVCSGIYVLDEDRYSMQILAEALRYGTEHRVISEDDLYTTEPEVIRKLRSDVNTASMWDCFRTYTRIRRASGPGPDGCWRRIAAKKRFIDPLVSGKGRISTLSPAFADSLGRFLDESEDYWMCGMR